MKTNNKPIAMGLVTIILSLILMNLSNFAGILPDSIICTAGVLVSIGAVVSIFFTVRTAVQMNEKKNNSQGKE